MFERFIRLFIKDADRVKEPSVRQAYGRFGSIVGMIGNLFLCSLKILIGSMTASISIVADGLNNLSDMGSSVITMIGFKMAEKPADEDHPFGHGRMEYMSAFLVAVLILLVGFELLKSSVGSLIHQDSAPVYSAAALIILAVSILVKLGMFLLNRKLGKRISSEALLATAQDSLNDMVATGIILLSVGISMLVTVPFNLDAVMGILVAVFILYSGVMTARDTLDQILGGPPDPALIEEIEHIILSFREFIGIHDLMVHNYGPGRQFASIHVEVPQNIDIVTCHEQIDLCEKLVQEKLNLPLVIHMDPIDTDNALVQQVKEGMAASLQDIHEKMSLHDFRMTPAGKQRTNLIFDVVVPTGLKLSEKELLARISDAARQLDPTYCCVVTLDSDFTGHSRA